VAAKILAGAGATAGERETEAESCLHVSQHAGTSQQERKQDPEQQQQQQQQHPS